MRTRPWSFGVMACLLVANSLHAQSVNLTAAPLADRCVRNELTMELDGKISVKHEAKDIYFPHKATAKHVFMERYLEANGAVADKAARFYTTAQSAITFNNDASSKRTLRADRRFLVAHRLKEQVVTYSPKGALTRDEMELTEHFDTMAVSGLLPGKSVEVAKAWAIPNAVVLALCELDGVTENNLQGKLALVKDHVAEVAVTGKVNGINLGAQVEMDIDARFLFDMKTQSIDHLLWKETDKRQQGPITPALTASVTITLKRTAIEEPEQLNKFALVPIPTTATPPSNLTNIEHMDAKNRFGLSYARDWHVVSPDDSPQLVLRQMERGDFIAQTTITAWKKTDPKNVMTLDQFAQDMAKTPGWAEDKEIERKELKDTSKAHQIVYRVASAGELDGVRTIQYYYLIVSPQGEQLIVTFSVVPQHVPRLGSRDLDLVREVVFPER